MLNRRRFLQSIVAAATTPAVGCTIRSNRPATTALQPDPNQIIELPDGFTYTVVSSRGEPMSDGLMVPGAHDGMAAFAGENGRVILVRNHEISATDLADSPFGDSYAALPDSTKRRLYDRGADTSPSLGGTTTTVFNPATSTTERQFLSLGGTEWNCAGGKTPWGSWLTCEETFAGSGTTVSDDGSTVSRDKNHGYIFEVPAYATELVAAVPLKAMGRFEHEAAAVHEPTGIVYLTEDQWHSLFYRFIPNVPGKLQEGGRLQALAEVGEDSQPTHNWDREDMRVDRPVATRWIDLEDVDGSENDLRLRGAAAGATTFARGEGVTVAGDRFAFACTIGGSARLGQIFTYKPSPLEGTAREQESPGELTLIAESDKNSLLKNCDNLTMAPWGDLIVCEDVVEGSTHCSLVGIRPDGSQYLVAHNAYSESEVAGVCFSPDGKTMFLNIQYPGMTIAITGPWPS
jgi:secreted PhoX family phosphatase